MKIITRVKNSVNNLLSILNLYIQKKHPGVDSDDQLVKILAHFKINYIIDIGANIGQFSETILSTGFKGGIISFEPLSSAYKVLLKNSSNYLNWKVHKRCAIGNIDGNISINISKNSVSSSILPVSKTHVEASNDSKYIGSESVEIFKLDTVFANNIEIENKNVFLKIDTQGYEWDVLLGADLLLNHTLVILCELSYTNLYNGQKQWLDIVLKLKSLGFELWAIQYGLTEAQSGRSLQSDGIFYKKQ